jgi:hypothetical protein
MPDLNKKGASRRISAAARGAANVAYVEEASGGVNLKRRAASPPSLW